MMSEVQLGSLVLGQPARDAIHVAVIAVIAKSRLSPGQHVGLADVDVIWSSKPHVGIVDPFLTHDVRPGDRCWLLLYPQTVTGMRHHWRHPAFDTYEDAYPPSQPVTCSKEESEKWLRDFCDLSDCPEFETLIAAATGGQISNVDPEYYGTYDNDGEYLFFSGRDAHGDIPPQFWDHVENYTGSKCLLRAKYFSCSC